MKQLNEVRKMNHEENEKINRDIENVKTKQKFWSIR